MDMLRVEWRLDGGGAQSAVLGSLDVNVSSPDEIPVVYIARQVRKYALLPEHSLHSPPPTRA